MPRERWCAMYTNGLYSRVGLSRTSTIVLVCPSVCRLAHLISIFKRIAVCLSAFTAAQDARWPSPQADLANIAIYQIPPKRQGRSSFAIMHSLDVYHLPGSKPEVITSRAPATECLHARVLVARMRLVVQVSPPDPDSCQMVLALISRTAFSRESAWVEIRCLFHAQPLRCVHGVWHVLVIHG